MTKKYGRILLKISGEALAGDRGNGIDPDIANRIAAEIKEIYDGGTEIAIVLGGGNIFRGVAGAAQGLDRTSGDTVGMLATLINSLLFREYLQNAGVSTKVLSAIQVDKTAEFYTIERAASHIQDGNCVIIACGTGNPYFTTDTAAALRCVELKCDILIKATKVDGVYDSDPAKNPKAKKINTISHLEAIEKNIRVMDSTAFSLCMENDISIIVFKLLERGNLRKCIEGIPVGSIVKKGE